MITPKRQQELYTKAFRFMREHKVQYIPLDIVGLCQSCNVELVSLSRIVRDTGLTKEDIFSIWGNKDGSITSFRQKDRIAYNDHSPIGRLRFTICEELGHIICGHTKDPTFNMFCQTYDESVYAMYDEEAHLVAGFLVCHPKFFYTYARFLNPENLAKVCGISLQCASVRYEVLQKYQQDIESNVMYRFLSLPRAKEGMRKYETRQKLNRRLENGSKLYTI